MRRLLLTSLAVTLAVTGVAQSSLGAFTSTSVSTGSVTASADWTPPTVSLRQPAAVLRGTVTLTADASDTETSVAKIVLEHRPTGTSTWTDNCTAAPAGGGAWSCPFATTGVGNTTVSAIETVLVDIVAPSVTVTAPSGTLSGTVTIGATASDAHSGISEVTIQRRLVGASDWTTICVDTTSPYSCRSDTTRVDAGTYDLRAILTDTVDVLVGSNINDAVQARVGAINLRGDYIKNRRESTVNGTLAVRTAVVDGVEVTVLTIRFDQTPHHNVARTFNGTATMVWTSRSVPVRATDVTRAAPGRTSQVGGRSACAPGHGGPSCC